MANPHFPPLFVSPFCPVEVITPDSGELTVTWESSSVQLSREVIDGVASFDVAAILRTGFRDRTEPYPLQGVTAVWDFRLSGVEFTLQSPQTTSEVIPLRVVPVRGKSNDPQTWGTPSILISALSDSGFCEIPRYEGYPLEIGIRASESPEEGFSIVSPSGITDFVVNFPSRTITIDCYEADSLFSANQHVEVVDSCLPDHPVYARWVNPLGGWEYWMFHGAKGFIEKTDKPDPFLLYGWDDPKSTKSWGGMTPTGTNLIRCGAEQLSEAQFKSLRSIGRSPLVQIYAPERNQFEDCYVRSTEFEWNTRFERGQIDIEMLTLAPFILD